MATFGPMVEGETDNLGPFTIESDGAAFNLTGYTVAIALTNGAGADVTAQGTLAVATQTGATVGQVTYTPHAADFTRATGLNPRSPEKFGIRFKVTRTSDSKFKYFPNGAPDSILVYAR